MRVARRLEGDLQRQAALAPRRSKVRRVWSEGSKPQREGRIPERAQTSGGVRGAPAGGYSGLAVPKTHSDTFGARIPGRTRAGRAAPALFYVVNITLSSGAGAIGTGSVARAIHLLGYGCTCIYNLRGHF